MVTLIHGRLDAATQTHNRLDQSLRPRQRRYTSIKWGGSDIILINLWLISLCYLIPSLSFSQTSALGQMP